MTPHLSALGFTLIHFCWQAALIAALYKLVEVCAPKLRNPERYLLGLVALVAMLVTAVATFVYEDIRLAAEPTVIALAPAGGAQPADSVSMRGLLPWIDAAWLMGVAVLSLRMAGGLWFIRRLATAAQAVPDAVARRFDLLARRAGLTGVRVRLHAAIDGPFVVGVWRSVVYLPVSAVTRLSPDQLDAVLAHELEHIRRADYLWNLVQSAIETLFFFHPAVWWLGGRLRDQRELCCDDAAVTMCRDPLTYATALLHLEEERRVRPRLAVALNGQGSGKALVSRIARVLGERAGMAKGRPPVVYALPGVLLVLLACLAPGAQVAARQAGLVGSEESAAAMMDDATASSVESQVHTPAAAWNEARTRSVAAAGEATKAAVKAKAVAEVWNWTDKADWKLAAADWQQHAADWQQQVADWQAGADAWRQAADIRLTADNARAEAAVADADRATAVAEAEAAGRQVVLIQRDDDRRPRVIAPEAPRAPEALPAPQAAPAPAAAPAPPEVWADRIAPPAAPQAPEAPRARVAPLAAPTPPAVDAPAPPAPPPYVPAARAYSYKLTATGYKTIKVKPVKVKQDITVPARIAPQILLSIPGATVTPNVAATADSDVTVHVNINIPAKKIKVPVYDVN